MADCVTTAFISFSPTFFVDYYAANSWRICRTRYTHDSEAIQCCTTNGNLPTTRQAAIPALGVLDDTTYFLLVCVQRLRSSRDDIVPQQSYFRERVWDRSEPAIGPG